MLNRVRLSEARALSLPAPREVMSHPTQRLLDRAGLCPGHRILNLGALLYDREISQQGLDDFHVLALREDAGPTVGQQLQPVDGTGSLYHTVSSIDDLALSNDSFDAVVALDWRPVTTLAAAVRLWRYLLVPDVGVVILQGTDIPTVHDSHRRASQQWIDKLTSAGFMVDTVTITSIEPRHYAALADKVRLVSEPLRAVLGTELAESYLAHVELLSCVTREGSSHRFEIIAKMHGRC